MTIGLELTDEQRVIVETVREFVEEQVVPVADAMEHRDEYPAAIVEQMKQMGLFGVTIPEEYGGLGERLTTYALIVVELARGWMSLSGILNTHFITSYILRRHGTDEQKARWLPAMATGEVRAALSMSEPGVGSDVASITCRARLDGDEYVVDGQKVFTSLADQSDYVWLAVRTDTEVPKHKGLSIIIVPTSASGFSLSPIRIVGGGRTNATFYDNVRVPVANRVGGENEGWKLMTTQLNHERVALCNAGTVYRHLENVRRWASETKLADGSRVIDQEWVRLTLARVAARTEFLRLMNWKVAWALSNEGLGPGDASTTKVFGTELFCESYRLLLEVMGQAGYLKRGSPGAILQGRLERSYSGTLILTFGGGTNEVQRDIIAMTALGMPRAPR
jgi:3-oxocholest-4-en-26-oyl-CoA dehydrogenase alpha subunit